MRRLAYRPPWQSTRAECSWRRYGPFHCGTTNLHEIWNSLTPGSSYRQTFAYGVYRPIMGWVLDVTALVSTAFEGSEFRVQGKSRTARYRERVPKSQSLFFPVC